MLPTEYYHVYNHAVGNEKLFTEEQNYYFFLNKVDVYLIPVVKIHAYCLLSNHFHFLLEVREEKELLAYFKMEPGAETNLLESKLSKCFSNMFNAYTQAYNKLYHRMGGLFMQNFRRKEILNMEDYKTIVRYIHTNPVHHGFCRNIADWKFSSYNSVLSNRYTLLEREYVLNTFEGREAFIQFHLQPIDLKFDIRL